MRLKIIGFFLVLGILIVACAPASGSVATSEQTNSTENVSTLKLAVLPIIDTLPLYVAEAEGLFAKQGVTVELIPVASAPERDQLLAAGQADGTINETLAVML
ncbi:MAG TPA: ABC transporter substrate-binding protein, partial [Anaerolineales bacterium]|nr:ABC transporter substrate-binding protein [Anaerolineales bacterium]